MRSTRITRTFLNAPFCFDSPDKFVKAGEKRVWEALEDARTQHRQKTTAYVYDMAQAFEDGEAMNLLNEMVNEKGPDEAITEIGKTANEWARLVLRPLADASRPLKGGTTPYGPLQTGAHSTRCGS